MGDDYFHDCFAKVFDNLPVESQKVSTRNDKLNLCSNCSSCCFCGLPVGSVLCDFYRWILQQTNFVNSHKMQFYLQMSRVNEKKRRD